MEPRGSPSWRRYLRFWGPDPDADVEDEIRFHLEMRTRDFERRGLPPEEARRAALARFGDIERVEGTLRDHDHRRERGRHRRELMTGLTQDLRYALRALRRSPAFTAVAVITLALGIGATTAIFSVVNAIVLRPLPYAEPDRLVMVWMDNTRMGMREDIHSYPNYADLREQNEVMTDLALYSPGGFNLTLGCVGEGCDPERISAGVVSANLLPLLGVPPVLGRVFTAEEEREGSDAVVVISHGLWTRHFAADPAAIGRTVRLNGRERTVIGVMPRDFAFPSRDADVWVPLVLPEEFRQQRNSFALYVLGRLRPGVPLERAQADMSAIMARLAEQYPGNEGFGINLVRLPDQVVGPALRTALWVMLGAVVAVLLIACANVANLMLSRASVREREIGVRLALGAGRGRLVRQLLTESVVLATLGGVLGVAIAWMGLRALTGLAPADIPRLDEVRVDGLVLGVTLLTVLTTGVAFGLVPSLQASRPNLTDALREGGRGGTAGRSGHRLRRALVAGQIALVAILLASAGLLVRSFASLQEVHLGFQPEGLVTMRLALPSAKYQEDPQRLVFFDALVDRVRELPGVQGVGAISSIFLSNTPRSTTFSIEGRSFTEAERGIEVPLDAVTTDYFRTMGIPLERGRAFTPQDGASAPPVVIINANMANRFWPGEDPVGKRMKYGGQDSGAPWMTIVGVVGDMRRTGYDAPVRFETFLPLAQYTPSQMSLVVRSGRDAAAVIPDVRAAVRELDADQPLFDVKAMEGLLGEMVAQRRFSMALLGTFAALALVLGLVGVYGVTAYLVAQRTHEVGLRIALGAQPRQLVRMVVLQGMGVAAVGIVAGVVGALATTRLMTGLLYGVSPSDATTLVTVVLLLLAATLLANWIPARRAARVDPLLALRTE